MSSPSGTRVNNVPSVKPRGASLEASAALSLVLSLAAKGGGGEGAYGSLKAGLRGAVARDPIDATVVTVLGGAFLFFAAERGHNPKVTSYWDALVFISTCLSVGYADIFAKTPAGKAIAAAVMTLGPALSGALLDAPASGEGTREGTREGTSASAPEAVLKVQEAIVGKLDAILEELRAARGARKEG